MAFKSLCAPAAVPACVAVACCCFRCLLAAIASAPALQRILQSARFACLSASLRIIPVRSRSLPMQKSKQRNQPDAELFCALRLRRPAGFCGGEWQCSGSMQQQGGAGRQYRQFAPSCLPLPGCHAACKKRQASSTPALRCKHEGACGRGAACIMAAKRPAGLPARRMLFGRPRLRESIGPPVCRSGGSSWAAKPPACQRQWHAACKNAEASNAPMPCRNQLSDMLVLSCRLRGRKSKRPGQHE